MKKLFFGLLAVSGIAVVAFSAMASRFVPTIRPNTQIGIISVGGLTKEEAAKKLRIWWESEKSNELKLVSDLVKTPLPAMTPGKLGITLDDATSVDQCEMSEFWAAAQSTVIGSEYVKQKLSVKFKAINGNLDPLKRLVKEAIGRPRPARVRYVNGAVLREPEVTTFELDESRLSEAVVAGIDGDRQVAIPIQEAPKRLPDAELAKITEVMAEFSTKFPAYQTSRNTNIRLAAGKLDGQVLMPGEQLSFNACVGRRTIKDGYKVAPVLVNGRHDTGIGGGICQVSTTFYNASLLADLKIVKRSNHSIPSAYVPVGRDATVDYGSLDFVIENNQEVPIAVTSTYEKGKITFRVLGKKVPGKSVKILTSGHSAWGNGVKTVVDRSLKPGTRRVIEKGSAGHAITTYRVVYENGKESRRDTLGRSIYRGSPRIIAVNNAPKPALQTPPPTPAPEANPTLPDLR